MISTACPSAMDRTMAPMLTEVEQGSRRDRRDRAGGNLWYNSSHWNVGDETIGESPHAAISALGGGSTPHPGRRAGGLAQLPAHFGVGGLRGRRTGPVRERGQDREPDAAGARRSQRRRRRRAEPVASAGRLSSNSDRLPALPQ